MRSKDALIISRQLKGLSKQNEVEHASDTFRPLVDNLNTLPLEQRGEKLEEWLSSRDDAASIRRSLVEVDPLGEFPDGDDSGDWGPHRLAEIPPAQEFPLDIFPETAARLVREGTASIGCPPDFIAVAMLSAVAGSIGRSVSLNLKPGYFAVSSIFAACVGPPSNGKTPAFKLAMEGPRIIEEELRQNHERALDDRKREPKENRAAKAPVRLRLILDDATMEAVVIRLGENPRGLLMARDELAGLLLGMNQYKSGGKGADRPTLLKIWSGDSITRDRVGDEDSTPMHCAHPCMSIIGGLPPDMLGSLHDQRGSADGFIDRFLFCYPVPLPVPFWSRIGISKEAKRDWADIHRRIRQRDMQQDGEKPIPHVAKFSIEGEQLWQERYNAFVSMMNSVETPQSHLGMLGKLREYAGRFALVLACLEHAADPTVDPQDVPLVGPDIVDKAWRLVDYFKAHCLRVQHSIRMGDGIGGKEPVKAIVDWLRAGKRLVFSEHELKQNRRWIQADDRSEALAYLTERNAIRSKSVDSNKKRTGRPTGPCYEVNPALLVPQNARNP